MCGTDGKKVTPVPIPNTAVKLLSADRSEGVTLCESRTVPRIFYYSEIAQLVERVTVNHVVVGSSPTFGACFGFVSIR